jgi:hypothetical protein
MPAPFELLLYGFLDARGVEQEQTTADADEARAFAARNRLVVLRNSYEFTSSVPVADFTGRPAVVAGD